MDTAAATTTHKPSLDGKGRGKMVWGGGGEKSTVHVKLSRAAPELSNITSASVLVLNPNQAERKCMEDIQILLRNPEVKTSDVDKVVHPHLG